MGGRERERERGSARACARKKAAAGQTQCAMCATRPHTHLLRKHARVAGDVNVRVMNVYQAAYDKQKQGASQRAARTEGEGFACAREAREALGGGRAEGSPAPAITDAHGRSPAAARWASGRRPLWRAQKDGASQERAKNGAGGNAFCWRLFHPGRHGRRVRREPRHSFKQIGKCQWRREGRQKKFQGRLRRTPRASIMDAAIADTRGSWQKHSAGKRLRLMRTVE